VTIKRAMAAIAVPNKTTHHRFAPQSPTPRVATWQQDLQRSHFRSSVVRVGIVVARPPTVASLIAHSVRAGSFVEERGVEEDRRRAALGFADDRETRVTSLGRAHGAAVDKWILDSRGTWPCAARDQRGRRRSLLLDRR
jgi:hypothetical protein